jgi:hypothetical protein
MKPNDSRHFSRCDPESALKMLLGEAGQQEEAPAAAEEIEVPAHQRRKAARRPLPDNLPHVTIEVLPPEVECKGRDAFEQIGCESRDVLERRPASMVIVEIKRGDRRPTSSRLTHHLEQRGKKGTRLGRQRHLAACAPRESRRFVARMVARLRERESVVVRRLAGFKGSEREIRKSGPGTASNENVLGAPASKGERPEGSTHAQGGGTPRKGVETK